MQRIKQGTASQIAKQFYSGSTVADPGAVTVTVTGDDGTLVASGPAGGSGTGPRTFTLTTTHTASLDRLTVLWTSASLGTLDSTVEIVGDFLFATAELDPLVPAATTDAEIQAARTRVEQALEDACGVAFVPRYDRATVLGDGSSLLRVGRPYLRRVRWASTSTLGLTTALTTTDIAALTAVPYGFVTGGYRWTTGSLVTVGFEHGMDRPPEPARAAALDYARFLLTQDQSIDSRVTQLQTDDGTLVFGGGQTGLPGVDRVIDQYRLPVIA
jgi:hypothetical protein